jgi:hypothetical protein
MSVSDESFKAVLFEDGLKTLRNAHETFKNVNDKHENVSANDPRRLQNHNHGTFTLQKRKINCILNDFFCYKKRFH